MKHVYKLVDKTNNFSQNFHGTNLKKKLHISLMNDILKKWFYTHYTYECFLFDFSDSATTKLWLTATNVEPGLKVMSAEPRKILARLNPVKISK